MSEQKFENQVRQAMDEFSISPTAPVWDKIAAEIKRKKDRRRFVLWLLPLVLLSSGITWWVLSNENSSAISQQTESANQNITKKTITSKPNKIDLQGKEIMNVKAESKKQDTVFNKENDTKPPFSPKDSGLFRRGWGQKTTYPSSITAKTQPKNAENKIVQSAQATKKINEEKLFPAETPRITKERLQEDLTKKDNAIISNDPSQNKDLATPQKTDTIQKINQPEQKPADTAKIPEKTEEQKPQNKKTKKLQFGAIVQVGFSGITSGLLDGFGQKSLADFLTPNSLQYGPGSVPNLAPSNIKRGFSYSLGFNVRKNISVRSAISSGAKYQYYSTGINVGTKARDSVNSVSRNANTYRNDNQSNDYTNQFHFITLPFSYHYQLLKKLPLHIGAGLQVSQLISSNALHYNGTANIYYKDNSLLNKTQAAVFTNLTYKLRQQRKFSLDVGPQFNYSLTPLNKNGSSQKQHLFFMGLNTQLRF